MENYRTEELRAELNQLLNKQAEVLESQLRQEVVHEICNQLANSIET